MNHDELLEALEDIGHEVNHGAAYVVLKSIIELHKPKEVWGNTNCGFCFNLAWEPSGLEMMGKHFAYPCPTMQVIEKELL